MGRNIAKERAESMRQAHSFPKPIRDLPEGAERYYYTLLDQLPRSDFDKASVMLMVCNIAQQQHLVDLMTEELMDLGPLVQGRVGPVANPMIKPIADAQNKIAGWLSRLKILPSNTNAKPHERSRRAELDREMEGKRLTSSNEWQERLNG